MDPAAPSPENAAQRAAVRLEARAALRREKIAARLALDPAAHAALSARVEAALAALFEPRPPGRLAFCWPLRQEFDARPFAARLRARGWRICLPVVTAEAAPLAFRDWAADAPLIDDRYGIPTPATGEFVEPDALLIPLVAFDAANYRIGYGGGYFDRTLAALAQRGLRPLAVGVGFELARVADTLPGPHDVRLDAVVTEAGCCIAP